MKVNHITKPTNLDKPTNPTLEGELARDPLFGESGYYVHTGLKVGPDYGTFEERPPCTAVDSKGNCTKYG